MFRKVYFCGRKTCPNSSVLYHRRCIAIIEFFMSTFVYVLHEIQVFCNFTPSISVDVAFLVQHFAFVVKTRISPYLFKISSSWMERDFLSGIFPKVQFIFKLIPNLNFLHIHKVFFVLFLYYSTFRCPQLLCAIWFRSEISTNSDN